MLQDSGPFSHRTMFSFYVLFAMQDGQISMTHYIDLYDTQMPPPPPPHPLHPKEEEQVYNTVKFFNR